jgi:L-threonylcarbamoyladenylate synthase
LGEKIRKIDTKEDLMVGLEEATQVIRSGGVVAFPTESFYGLGVNLTDERALQRLFVVKKRRSEKPILILIPSVTVLGQYVGHVSEIAHRLINRYWPGGLTLVFEASQGISPLLTAGTGKIGVRLSGHPIARALTQALGLPITGTSANISGGPPCVNAREVLETLGEDVDLILDGGKTKGGKGSTVLDVTVKPPVIMREGMINRKELEDFFSGQG